MNKDYTTQNLLETLFGTSSYVYKHLNDNERTALRMLGYKPIDWDILLSEGRLTMEDVFKRVDLYKQLQALDKEITERKAKKQPRFKKGDALKTKADGTILITGVSKQEPFTYAIVNEDGAYNEVSEETILKIKL